MQDLFVPASLETWTALTVALDVAFKATALILLAYAGHAILGKRRALTRSALWNACLAGLLLLPAASIAFPRCRVAVPFWNEPAAVLSNADEPAPPALSANAGAELEATVSSRSPSLDSAFRWEAAVPSVEPQSDDGPALVPPPPRFGVSIAGLILTVYLTVAFLFALRLAASLRHVAALARLGEPVTNPAWRDALDFWRERLRVKNATTLFVSDRVSVPVVLGLLRPVIILPSHIAESTRRELIDAVLAHELAHVRRCDYVWNLIRKIVL